MSARDVIGAALRLLENHEARRDAFVQALIDGENSGPATPLNMKEIIRAARAQVGLDGIGNSNELTGAHPARAT